MDYINLERVQPFAREEDQQPECSRGPSQVVVSRRPLLAPTAANTSNVTTINTSVFKSKNNKLTGSPFDSLREQLYNALPIPPQVVPVMASTEQILEYENFFAKPPGIVQNYTISEILDPFFGWSSKISKEQLGKILFVRRILHRISANEMNFDVAIICKNCETQELLQTCLSKFDFNSMSITQFTEGDRGVYGLIVKIRRTQSSRREYTPIIRNSLDMLFIFDSACHTDHSKELAVFKGVHTAKPVIVYLVSMDSAEMRIHTYNRFINDSARYIHWNTRVGDISNSLKQVLLFQPNRKPNNVFCIGYNDFVSQSFFNWLKDNLNDEYDSRREANYEFKGPSKGALYNELMNFSISHPPAQVKPKDPSPSPFKSKKPRPNVAQANAAMNAVLNAASSSQMPPIIVRPPPPAPKVSSKAKESLTQIVAANAKKPSTITAAGPANAYRPVFAQPVTRDPHVAPAGIHPDRMPMIQNTSIASSSSSSPGPSSSASKDWSSGATSSNTSVLSQHGSKRSRATDIANDDSRSLKLVKTTTPSQSNGSVINNGLSSQDTGVSSTSATPNVPSSSEALGATSTQEVPAPADSEMPDASAIVNDLGGKFGDFLEKALKQFEADVLGLNIKL